MSELHASLREDEAAYRLASRGRWVTHAKPGKLLPDAFRVFSGGDGRLSLVIDVVEPSADEILRIEEARTGQGLPSIKNWYGIGELFGRQIIGVLAKYGWSLDFERDTIFHGGLSLPVLIEGGPLEVIANNIADGLADEVQLLWKEDSDKVRKRRLAG